MDIQTRPLSPTLVNQLFELASTPFELKSFSKKWQEFGWRYTPGTGDEFGFGVTLPDDASDEQSLRIDPLGHQVIGATLSFYAWEGYDPTFHRDPAQFGRERDAYNSAFEAGAELAEATLPPPMMQWT